VLALIAGLGVLLGLALRSFDYDEGYHVTKEEVKQIESSWRTVKGGRN